VTVFFKIAQALILAFLQSRLKPTFYETVNFDALLYCYVQVRMNIWYFVVKNIKNYPTKEHL